MCLKDYGVTNALLSSHMLGGAYICNVWDNKFQVDIIEKNVLCKHCQHGTRASVQPFSPSLSQTMAGVQWCLPNWKTILAHLSWSLIESWYGETSPPFMVLSSHTVKLNVGTCWQESSKKPPETSHLIKDFLVISLLTVYMFLTKVPLSHKLCLKF